MPERYNKKVSIQIFTFYLHVSFVFVTGEAKYKKL